jgi:uncharacterized membrane protein YphA (DoxX/SURF4 family)
MMNGVLWVLQFLLALVFLAHGWLMLAPPAAMVEQINASIPVALRLFIGVAEVLAAIGLTLPGVTRVQPWLVPAAAAGLTIVMVCATILHLIRSEFSAAVTAAILLGLVVFVGYMRWKVMPIRPRVLA